MAKNQKVVVIGSGKFGPEIGLEGPDLVKQEFIADGAINFSICREESIDTKSLLPGISVRLVDKQSLQAGIAARKALGMIPPEATLDWERAGVVLGSSFGATASMFDFYHKIVTDGVNYISPMEFPNTVSNAAASRVGIWLSIKGHCVSISNGNLSGLDAVGFAYKELKKNRMDYYLAGGSEEISDAVKMIYSQIYKDRHELDRKHGVTREVLYEGAAMLLLTTNERTEEMQVKPLCVIDGYLSGTADQNQVAIIAAIEKLIAKSNYSKEEVLLCAGLAPGVSLGYSVIEELGRRFHDRVMVYNRFGTTIVNYFAMDGINGILAAVEAIAKQNESQYHKAVVFNLEKGGRFSAVAIQKPD